MTESETYLRVRIGGCLQVTSEMHIGDGQEMPLADRGKKSAEGHYNTVCTGIGDLPYIPGSSLRGALRGWATEHNISLFGDSPEAKTSMSQQSEPTSASAGQLRVMDAMLDNTNVASNTEQLPFWSNRRHTCIRHAVAIDATTRVAKEKHLFQYEMVPVGACFNVLLELHGTPKSSISKASVAHLLSLLAAWDGQSSQARLGGGQNTTWGKVGWLMDKQQIEAIGSQALAQWLISPQALDTSLPWQDISKSVPITPHVGHPVCQIMVKLKPKAPYLSNEIGLVSDTKQAPKLRYARTREGFPMIPARSVKGWVRHQAQKIAATIAHQHFDISAHDAQDCVKNWVDGLFGNDLQRGWLQMSDAVSTEPATQHEQTFNAIDRFTGGVTHLEGQQSLYSVEAALNELQTQIGLDVRLLTEEYNHWKGLLLLVLRDALAGELWLGWGQARGYGEFTLEITLPKNQDTYASEIASDQISHLCDVSALLQHPLITAEGDVWVQALHSALGKHLQSSLPKEPAHA